MPELIVMVGLWWGSAAGLKYYFGLPASLVTVLAVATCMFIWQILQTRKSNREYAQFVAEHELGTRTSAETQSQEGRKHSSDTEDKIRPTKNPAE